jgi:hypothetical protein
MAGSRRTRVGARLALLVTMAVIASLIIASAAFASGLPYN